MLDRFTDRARRVVVLAQEEARRLGHRELDVGHLVLGALTTMGDTQLNDVTGVREVVESSLGGPTTTHGSGGHIPFTPDAITTLEQSLRLVLSDRRSYVDDGDLLLAALDQPRVAEPLLAGRVDVDTLRSTTVAARNR
jgi:ATP-dependent Clp protease ATP-binding subunit ClpA